MPRVFSGLTRNLSCWLEYLDAHWFLHPFSIPVLSKSISWSEWALCTRENPDAGYDRNDSSVNIAHLKKDVWLCFLQFASTPWLFLHFFNRFTSIFLPDKLLSLVCCGQNLTGVSWRGIYFGSGFSHHKMGLAEFKESWACGRGFLNIMAH